ncbi:hypothetical protein BC833DRAFT_610414 [Globomyces pollinis-pini]|nr:hypothetical protein BC833DRAFT_610414 [Globomyces pollinis-pini]
MDYHPCGICKSLNIIFFRYISSKIFIYATPQEIWGILTNITNWPLYFPDIHISSLDYPIKGVRTGATGTIKNLDSKIQPFTLVDLDKDHYFAYEIKLNGCKAHYFWEITEDVLGFELEMGVILTGWLAPFYRPFMKNHSDIYYEILVHLKDHLETVLD